MRYSFLVLFATVIVVFSSCNSEPETGGDVIRKMHSEWNGKMPNHMMFEQQTSYFTQGFVDKDQLWHVAISSPGKMHIRINDFESGNGMIFNNDSAYYFTQNKMTFSEMKVHYLLNLSFDVYQQDPEHSISKLTLDEFDLRKVYATHWNGRDVYVVGASDSSDVQSNQFIIDKEKWITLRTVRRHDKDVFAVDFTKYEEHDGHYLATEMVFSRNGEKTLLETYKNIRFPEEMDSKIFDSKQYSDCKW